MADWNLPLVSSLYVDVLNYLKLRDEDALTLVFVGATNLPEHAIRYDRGLNLFQEWQNGVWSNKTLSVAGGGTGASTPPQAIINLGLGSMATQSASNVNITGGILSGVTINDATYNRGNIYAMTEIQGVNLRATGALVGPGMYITNLDANAIDRGMVPVANLGSGTANATTYLRGDRTWASIIVNPSRWTDSYYYDHAAIPMNEINGMYIVNGHSPNPQNLHLPLPNNASIVNPHAPLRITTYYGTASIYGGYPGEAYTEIGGRPSPFIMNIPRMSIDLIPDPNTNIWKVF
jgi:hypothetical protein